MRLTIAIAILLLFISGCANWKPPENVILVNPGKSVSYMDEVNFSYHKTEPVSFSELKLCVAESISNDAVTLKDSSNSFVGPFTGTYYQHTNSQTVQGGNVFKYIDDRASALIATGTTDGGQTALGLTRDIVKFDLKASSRDTDVKLKFSNITRAQQDTGNASNTGFQPVGTWSGAGAKRIYTSLQAVAEKIKTCLQ